MREQVIIHTDGACRGNPGPGGWGATLQYRSRYRELSGSEALTTNNRMELIATIQALGALNKPCRVILYTDSTYVKNGIEQWLSNWRKNNWKTAAKKPVKNRDLWEQLDALTALHQVQWEWVKGHSGNPGNERADALANQAIDQMKQQIASQ